MPLDRDPREVSPLRFDHHLQVENLQQGQKHQEDSLGSPSTSFLHLHLRFQGSLLQGPQIHFAPGQDLQDVSSLQSVGEVRVL